MGGTIKVVSFPSFPSFSRSSIRILYTCTLFAANEPPTAAAKIARSVTEASANAQSECRRTKPAHTPSFRK